MNCKKVTSRESRNRGQSWGWERPGEKPRVSERPAPEALPACAIVRRRRRGTLADERPPPKRPLFEEPLPNMGNQEGGRERQKQRRGHCQGCWLVNRCSFKKPSAGRRNRENSRTFLSHIFPFIPFSLSLSNSLSSSYCWSTVAPVPHLSNFELRKEFEALLSYLCLK